MMLKVKSLFFEEAFVNVEAGASAASSFRFHQGQKALSIVDIEPRIIRKLS
jgi:hypothetical protein